MNALRKFTNGLLGFAVLLLVSAGACFAQSTATLSGTVTDPSGAVVPGAQVTVHSLATGLDRQVTTDSAGLYAVPSLEPGDYQVQAKASGFSIYTVKQLTLQVDQRATLNMPLAVSSAGETIQVESSAATQIETTTMTVGQVIDRNTVQEIPLNGRHFLDLTVLTPGGVVAPTAGSLTSASRGLGANSFITAGNREDSVNFQINGINLNDMSQNQITFQPSINTTSEFKVDNSTFSAEYGRSSGSIVNVSTRSGTNSFHGEAFDYFRNEALDARNYFNRDTLPGLPGKKAPLKRNNFGGALGGPIWKDRTFFFGSYEGLRQNQGVLLNSSVFSPAVRADILANGQPAAKALIALVPVGNDATQTHYTAFTPGPVQTNQYTIDILQKITDKDQLHGFYAFQSDSRTEPNLQGNTIPGFGDHRPAHRQIITLNETHIFTPNFVNELRVGGNRISITFTPNTPLNPVDYHIADGITTPLGLPQITVSDLSLNFGGPAGFPQGRHDTYFVLSDAATVLRGRHTIKFGGEYRRFIGDSFAQDIGTLTYATTAQFKADVAPTFNINPTNVTSRIFINAQGYFIQDNYKLNPHLTLEYGFRFEWNGTPTEGSNRLVIFDPGSVSLIRTRTNGIGGIYKQNYNFMPRLGFAWDVFATGRTVLRGGYSILSDQPVSGTATALASNPPFSNAVTYSNASAPIPVNNLFNSAAAAGIAISNTNPNFRNAYTESYNLNLQQAGPAGIVFSAGYYGSVGRHLRARTNQNQPIAGGPARPFTKLSATSPIDPLSSIANVNIAEANSVGSSNYNALWLTASKTAGHGLSFDMNYNWSKSLDTNSLGSQGGYTFQDSNNPGNNYGPSDFDTRNHYAGRVIYALPFKGNRFKEGFQVSGIFQYQTGNPFTVTYNTSTYTGVAGLIRVNQVAPVKIQKIQQPGATNVSYVQSTVCPIAPTLAAPTTGCSFQNPATQATSTSPVVFTGLGTMSRGALFGPGFADFDISGEKDTKITERVSFKLRADAFDVLNHPNFGQPTANSTSSAFGQISSTRFATSDAGSSRQLQISGKFIF